MYGNQLLPLLVSGNYLLYNGILYQLLIILLVILQLIHPLILMMMTQSFISPHTLLRMMTKVGLVETHLTNPKIVIFLDNHWGRTWRFMRLGAPCFILSWFLFLILIYPTYNCISLLSCNAMTKSTCSVYKAYIYFTDLFLFDAIWISTNDNTTSTTTHTHTHTHDKDYGPSYKFPHNTQQTTHNHHDTPKNFESFIHIWLLYSASLFGLYDWGATCSLIKTSLNN